MQVSAAKTNLGVWQEHSLLSHLAVRNHTSGDSAKGITVSTWPVGLQCALQCGVWKILVRAREKSFLCAL